MRTEEPKLSSGFKKLASFTTKNINKLIATLAITNTNYMFNPTVFEGI